VINVPATQNAQMRGRGFGQPQTFEDGSVRYPQQPYSVTPQGNNTQSFAMRGRGYDTGRYEDGSARYPQQPYSITPQGNNLQAFAMRGRGYGGGLPSNAALGGATTNPQGLWAGVSGSAGTVNYQQNFLNTPRTSSGAPVGSGVQPSNYLPGVGRTTAPLSPTVPYRSNPNLAPNQESYLLRNPEIRTVLNNIYSQVDDRFNPNSRLPTEAELRQLEAHGWIKRDTSQTPTPAYASGGYRRGKGGGGGGGGGGSAPRLAGGTRGGGVQQAARLPAFSSGASFRGLVNWRI
jgi:hypothetical protein